VVNDKICPHGTADQIQFSGTKIRDMLVKGEIPPVEMMRPEVARIIMGCKEPFNE
jgi:sulfate adenylyltransferase